MRKCVYVCVGRNITPSIHHCERGRSQNLWQFYHETAGRLCVLETIAFLPFFRLCFSRVAAPGSLASPQIHLSGRRGAGWESYEPTFLPLSFLKGTNNGYWGQIIVMNMCLCAHMHTFVRPYLF